MTAQQSCERHPAAGPQPMTGQSLVGIFGTGRQMPAMEPDQRRQRVAIDLHQRAAGLAWCLPDTMGAIRVAAVGTMRGAGQVPPVMKACKWRGTAVPGQAVRKIGWNRRKL